MIYELVHSLSKFVVIYLDGIFIHNDHIAHHQLHDHILTLRPITMFMLLINHHIMTSFCTMVEFVALCTMLITPWILCIPFYIILISFMHFVTNNLAARTHIYFMDTLCALTIVFPSVLCVCSFCMYHIPETPWSTWIAPCLQLRPNTSPSMTTVSMVMRITIRGRIFPGGGGRWCGASHVHPHVHSDYSPNPK